MGTPETTTGTTYVRENMTVEYEIGGQTRKLGGVEPISFSRRTILVVVVPRGVGVGDRDSENPEYSPTYPELGEIENDTDESNATYQGDLYHGEEIGTDTRGVNDEQRSDERRNVEDGVAQTRRRARRHL
jgi:hypothetical protein